PRHHPTFPLFPYTTLFRSDMSATDRCQCCIEAPQVETACQRAQLPDQRLVARGLRDQLIELGFDPAHVSDFAQAHQLLDVAGTRDRKSTRLNSSHLVISYA